MKKKLPNNTHASFSFFSFFFLNIFGSFAPLSKWAEKHVQCQDWVLVTEVLKVIAFGQYGKKCAARGQTVLKTHALPHLWQSRFPNGFWELVPVARHYIANSFDLHRDSTRRLIVTSRVSGRKRRVPLCSQAVTGVTSTAAWRTGTRRTKSLVSIFTRFPKQLSSLDVGNQMTERCSQAMLGHRRYTLSESRRWRILRLPSSMYMQIQLLPLVPLPPSSMSCPLL